MVHHGIFFLNDTRRSQFNNLLYVLENNLTKWSDYALGVLPRTSYLLDLPGTAKDYLALPFFNPWLVGFVMGDGSFLVKANKDACFQVKQRTHLILFQAIALLFECNRALDITESGKYIQISMSSKADIQRVIKFFSYTCPMLMGYKNDQYQQWITYLKSSVRYRNLDF